MKQIWLRALLAALLVSASCQKQEDRTSSVEERKLVTSSIATPALKRGEFSVLFTGIGMLQPDTATAPTSDFFFDMPNVSKRPAQAVPANDLAHNTIPEHEAFLIVDPDLVLQNLTGQTLKVETTNLELSNGKYIVNLANEELSFVDSGPAPIVAINKDPKKDCPATEEDERNLFWIPSISRVANYSGKRRDVPLSSRVDIKGGYIDARIADHAVHQFAGKDGKVEYEQAIAQIVDWSFTTPSKDYVTILHHPINEPDKTAVFLRLKKINPKTKEAGFIWIGSAPVGEIRNAVSNGHDPVDQHFEVYYDVLAGPPGRLLIPVSTKPCMTTLATVPRVHAKLVRTVIGGLNCGPGDWP
jgi:hypothetical protein